MKIDDDGIKLGHGGCVAAACGCALIIAAPILALAAIIWACKQ